MRILQAFSKGVRLIRNHSNITIGVNSFLTTLKGKSVTKPNFLTPFLKKCQNENFPDFQLLRCMRLGVFKSNLFLLRPKRVLTD